MQDPGGCQRFGIPGMREMGLGQVKGSVKKAQKTKGRYVILK